MLAYCQTSLVGKCFREGGLLHDCYTVFFMLYNTTFDSCLLFLKLIESNKGHIPVERQISINFLDALFKNISNKGEFPTVFRNWYHLSRFKWNVVFFFNFFSPSKLFKEIILIHPYFRKLTFFILACLNFLFIFFVFHLYPVFCLDGLLERNLFYKICKIFIALHPEKLKINKRTSRNKRGIDF